MKNERKGCLLVLAMLPVAWGIIYLVVDSILNIFK